MEFLDQARGLLENLKKNARTLEQLQKEMDVASNDSMERLYGEEFEIVIEMSDIFTTLTLILDKMMENEDSSFVANRLRTQAESIVGGQDKYEFD